MNADRPLDPQAAREAARWLMRLGSSGATEADIRACAQWRARHAEHERAWQRAQALTQQFELIPPTVGFAALGRPASSLRRVAMKTAAAILLGAPVAGSAWNAAPLVRWRSDYHTAAGEQREWLLSDGTRLRLNTASALDQSLSDSEHQLQLREGEIYVAAAATPLPALRVLTQWGDIRAQPSTRFSVRLAAEQCQVHVIAGQVDVVHRQASVGRMSVRAAQQTAFDGGSITPSRMADAQGPDWLRGILYAENLRLDAFAAELARYRPGIVRCDPLVAGLRLSGVFQLASTDRVLRAITTLLPVQVQYRSSYWVTLAPAERQA